MSSIRDGEKVMDIVIGIGVSTSSLTTSEQLGTGPSSIFSGDDGEAELSTGIGILSTGGWIWEETSGGDGPPDVRGKVGDKEVKIWFRDSIPYTRVEKRASKSYNDLHPNSKISNRQPFVTTYTKETYEAVAELFGNKSREQILEDLEVLERVLADEKERREKIERLLEKV